jgi:hypothetical protein
MRIKLSDYILEQSISSFDISNIENEKIMAEIDVISAIIESYIKQTKAMMYMETKDFMDLVEAADDTEDVAHVSDAENYSESAASDVGKFDKIKDKFGKTVNLIKRFFKSVWRWIVHSTTRVMSLISNKKLDMLIKKVTSLSDETKEHYKILVPEKLRDCVIYDDSQNYHRNPFIMFGRTVEYYKDFFEFFKNVQYDTFVHSDLKRDKSSHADFVTESIKFCNDLDANLKSMRSLSRDQKNTGVYVDYEDTVKILTYLKSMTNMDWYNNYKHFFNDQYHSPEKTMDRIFEGFRIDEHNAKQAEDLYKLIKDVYSSLTLYVDAFTNMIVKTLESIKVKDEQHASSEDKDANVDDINAFIKSNEVDNKTKINKITNHGISASSLMTNILGKINFDSNELVTLYENQYVTGKSDSEKIASIEKCINHIKDNYSSNKLIDLINEYVSGSNNPSILSNDDNDKRKLYTEKLVNYLKKYEITDILSVAIILESMKEFDNPAKMFEHFGYKNMTVDKLGRMDKKLAEQLREFDSCVVW